MKIKNFILIAALLSYSAISCAQIQEGYVYDTLGRLVHVQENQTTKATYCYDDAGNRVGVVEGSSEVCPVSVSVPPAAPGNLQSGSHAGGGFNISWGGVAGAIYYELKFTNENYATKKTSSTSYSTPSGEGYRPVWVKACNGYTCSAKSYF